MDPVRLAGWLRAKGCPVGDTAPESLCRPELARLWEHLGVPGAQELDSGEQGTTCTGQWPPAASLTPQPAQEVEAVQAGLQHLAAQQAPADAPPVQELALRAFCSRLQALAAALSTQKELLQQSAQPLGEQTLDAFEVATTAQVRQGLAGNNLANTAVDWAAVSSTARARVKAGSEDATLSACPAAIFAASLARSQQAAVTMQAEVLDAAGKLTATHEANSAGAVQDALMYSGRNAEVKLFFQTQQVAEQERASAKTLLSLTETVDRLCGGSEAGLQRKRLLILQAENAGNRAAVTTLEKEMAELRRKEAHLQQVQATLAQVMDTVLDSRLRNMMLDSALRDLASSGAAFLAQWAPNATAVHTAITADVAQHQSTIPGLLCGFREALFADARTLMEVGSLPKGSVLAGQPGSALPVTSIQQRRMLKHNLKLVQALERSVATLQEAVSAAELADTSKVALAAQDFAQLTAADLGELRSFSAAAAEALEHGKTAVPSVLQAWWEQPALHATPWIKHDEKNAREWLTQIQAWHASKKCDALASQ